MSILLTVAGRFQCSVFVSVIAYNSDQHMTFKKSNAIGRRQRRLCTLVLCDTHDTSILIVDTYATILVSPISRYTAVYRSSTKYRETAQASRVSSIPCG